MNLNRELYEALGYCWHEKHAEYNGEIACTCWATFRSEEEFTLHCKSSNTDYVADPRLVIREMDKWDKAHHTHPDERFINNLGCMEYEVVSVDLILDTSGKLAQLALDWIKEQKEG